MIVLDTHSWLWWLGGDSRLSAVAREAIEASASVGVPAICCWEFAMLVARDKVRLSLESLEWIEAALAVPGVVLLPLSPRVAVLANTACSTLHRDPADRIIVATALDLGAPVVTADERIRNSGLVETLW